MFEMRISQDEVNRFAAWSADCNPLHVDMEAAKKSAFGGTIAHGALSVIECLQISREFLTPKEPITRLDIEFRKEVVPGHTYVVELNSLATNELDESENALKEAVATQKWNLVVHDGGAHHLVAQVGTAKFNSRLAESVKEWSASAVNDGVRSSVEDSPVNWTPDRFKRGQTQLGIHRFGEHSAAEDSALSTTQQQVLGLCSFIVGMKAPGLSSLFMRLNIEFEHIESTHQELAYRLTFKDYDPYFRLLDTELEIATREGEPVARAEMQSYVRFPQSAPDPMFFDGKLVAEFSATARKKVALICGASRGLGAEMAAALGFAKYHVFLSCRKKTDSVERLAQDIRDQGATAEIVIGDIGDLQWCQQTVVQIQENCGQLDVLILNACAPPVHQTLAGANPSQSQKYVSENLALVHTPLITFLPLVEKSSGTVVGISSSFVDESPVGFADYLAVKHGLEAALKIAAKENPNSRFVVARPPKLRTSWNDTPTGAMGAIPPSVAACHIINATIASGNDANFDVVTAFPFAQEQQAIHQDPDWNLALVAGFTLDPIVNGFRRWSEELGLNIVGQIAPYAQILQQTLDPTSLMSQNSDGSVILLRVSDWLRERSKLQSSKQELRQWLEATVQEHVEAIKAHRSHAQGQTLLLLCPSSVTTEIDSSEFEAMERSIQSQLIDVPGLTVLNARDFHVLYDVPNAAIFDTLRDEIAHIPFGDGYYQFLATLMVRFFHRQFSLPKKVIVLDCDNTLWQGVVGELGPNGIEFDAIHHKLHQRLNELSAAGILICLCSKNEEQDVWDVFEQRKDFGLSREQVVAGAINWLPKSQNIQELAETLNLGLDSFVFLDDNPVECAEVRSGCPQVLTLQWPQTSGHADQLLDHLWELDVFNTTAEDKKRTQRYREEFDRQKSRQQAGSFQSFIDSLELNVDIRSLDADDLARASQLTMRTNQFNFTTIRRTESELQELVDNPKYACRTIRVSDRFGDYGLTGFLIVSMNGELKVDTFLLSCRVLGRGVEHRMASELGRLALEGGLSSVHWNHIPTERNTPARMFLDQIIDEDFKTDAASPCQAVIDAEKLAEFKLETNAAPQELVAKSTSSPQKQDFSPRERERQIERTASSLSSYRRLDASSELTPNEPGADGAGGMNDDEVANFVRGIFAKALKCSADQIVRIDRLDTLGCDSLRIVEITIQLTKRFSWLPKTLLFEHRSVSDIIGKIQQLASGTNDSEPQLVGFASPGTGLSTSNEIAIVGIGVNCAGGKSPQELWQTLVEGRSAIRKVPTRRDSFAGTLVDDREHFAGIIDGAADFDPWFFGISPREAEYMDPQLRLLLQTSQHAIEDAGGGGSRFDPDTGVFVGVMYSGYAALANAVATQKGGIYRCWEGFSLANRLSQILGSRGPSLSIDTACSSSATALHYACRSLQKRDCKVAIVSGVNLIVDPNRLVQLGRLGILSPSGKCVPFGDQADGTVMGEGVVTVLLKPLEDAIEQKDRVYAVVKGTGISSGAGSVGFTAPNPNAQSIATRRAIAAAGIDARSVSYIETHGTGTELGDPIEVRGLEMAYCDKSSWDSATQIDHRCTIGSIKPNVGHLEAGAGLMGVVKTALQLHHRTLVPSLTSEMTNPQIPFETLPFSVQTQVAAWETTNASSSSSQLKLPRRAGVNSFGVGGSNVHVILEEGPTHERSELTEERGQHLLSVSAPSKPALSKQIAAWQEYLNSIPAELVPDVCFSSNVGRDNHELRAAILIDSSVDNSSENFDSIQVVNSGSDSRDMSMPLKSAFMFSGQGAQYPQMMRMLYKENSVFRSAFDTCTSRLNKLLPKPIDDVVFSGEYNDRNHKIHQTGFTQPALFTVQYALYELWKSWGIQGDVLAGHSVGEIAAYCVGGGCTLEDGLRLVAARGQLMQALPKGGTMCAVALNRDELLPTLNGYSASVTIAALNGPANTVISGPVADVNAIANTLDSQSVKTTPLSVSHAFHSSLMDPMLDEFAQVLDKLDLQRPTAKIVSTATGQLIQAEMATPEYWLNQARNSVQFVNAMETLQSQGVTHFIELGPHPVMLGMGRQCAPDSEAAWLPSARRGKNDWSVILKSLGQLYADGFDVDWNRYDSPYRRRRVSTLGYQFDQNRIWLDELNSSTANQRSFDGNRDEFDRDGPVSSLMYQLDWEPVQQNERQAPSGFGKVLLVVGQASAVDPALTTALRNHGVTWATMEIRDLTTEQFITQLASHNDVSRVVFIADSFVIPDSESDASWSNSSDRVFELTRTLTALSDSQVAGARRLWVWVSRPDEDALDLAGLDSAPLWGFARVASLEYGELWGGIVEVDDWQTNTLSAMIETWCPTEDDQISLQGESRTVPRLKPIEDLECVVAEPKFEPGHGAILITGGLGGIGIQVAKWLAERGAKHLVLSSRSGKPSEDAANAIATLEAQNLTVDLIAADVSTPQGVQRCFEAAGEGGLTGIFHAAGVDSVASICDTSRADIELMWAAKIRGSWLLHEASLQNQVNWFVCFSSIASIWGSQGRSLYAAANSFLDTLVHRRRQRGMHGLAINFGPWSGGGMASDTALAELEKIGNYGLSPQKALQAIETLMIHDKTQAVVANMDWVRFRSILEARRPRPILGDLGMASPSTPESLSSGESDSAPWVGILQNIPEESQRDKLIELLGQEVSLVLGLPSGHEVGVDRSLYEMGLDSLMAVELTNALTLRTSIKNPISLSIDPTLNRMADSLLGPLTTLIGSPDIRSESDLASGLSSPPSKDVVVFYPELKRSVFEFCEKAWPRRRKDWIEPRWNWMYLQSAARLKVKPKVWLFQDEEQVVAHHGAQFVRLQVGGQRYNTAWFVETMVLDEYRDRGIGARLVMQSREEMPLNLSLGQTEQMRAILLRAGWIQVAPLETYLLLLKPSKVLKKKMPGPVVPLASAWFQLRHGARRLMSGQSKFETTVEDIKHFDNRYDELWNRVSESYGCSVVRDASYMNWKYVDQPGQSFERLEIREGERLVGCAVLSVFDPDLAYAYRRVNIIDIVSSAESQDLFAVLSAVVDRSKKLNADAIFMHLINHRIQQALENIGFLKRSPTRYLVVSPDETVDQRRLTDPSQWLVTQGDSDIDRPW